MCCIHYVGPTCIVCMHRARTCIRTHVCTCACLYIMYVYLCVRVGLICVCACARVRRLCVSLCVLCVCARARLAGACTYRSANLIDSTHPSCQSTHFEMAILSHCYSNTYSPTPKAMKPTFMLAISDDIIRTGSRTVRSLVQSLPQQLT